MQNYNKVKVSIGVLLYFILRNKLFAGINQLTNLGVQ